MFRLKHLDENEHPDAIMNPDGGSVNSSELLPAAKYIDESPFTYLKAQPNKFTHMVTAAAVFHNNRLLLVQRAEGDSYPGRWEIPGGSVDQTDKSIKSALARELREETGLVLKNILRQILPAETFNTGWAKRTKKWLKLSFVVDITDESQMEAAEEVTMQETKEKIGEQVAIETKKLEDLMDDAEKEALKTLDSAIKECADNPAVSEIGIPVIKLDPKEHQVMCRMSGHCAGPLLTLKSITCGLQRTRSSSGKSRAESSSSSATSRSRRSSTLSKCTRRSRLKWLTELIELTEGALDWTDTDEVKSRSSKKVWS